MLALAKMICKLIIHVCKRRDCKGNHLLFFIPMVLSCHDVWRGHWVRLLPLLEYRSDKRPKVDRTLTEAPPKLDRSPSEALPNRYRRSTEQPPSSFRTSTEKSPKNQKNQNLISAWLTPPILPLWRALVERAVADYSESFWGWNHTNVLNRSC
ncbi:hypothetical protein BH09BAC3_BH09BAC3_25900 [soil metagenome]